MTIYQKVLSVFGLLRDSINRRAARTELAPSFDTGVTYTVGRMVVYNSVLYRCTTQHTGAWDAEHFEETTVDAAMRSGTTVDAAMRSGTTVDAVTDVQLNGTTLTKTAGVVNVEALTGLKVNGTSQTPSGGVVDVAAITGVKRNGTALTPTGGVVDVEAITGVKCNGTALTPASGVVDVAAITEVKVNNTALTPTSGSVNIQAITGVKMNGTALTPTAGVVDIPTSNSWVLADVESGDDLTNNACNVYDASTAGGSAPNLYIPSPSGSECRQFALCIKNTSSWSGTITDRYTGEPAVLRWLFDQWNESTIDTVIQNKIGSGSGYFCFKVYEMFRGTFTFMDIY